MFSIKALEELNVFELKRELRVRKLDPKGKKEEFLERLENWIFDNGYEVDEYGFEDHGYIQLMAGLGANLNEQQQRVMNFLTEEEIRIKKLVSAPSKTIKESLTPEMERQEKITEVSFDKAATSYQPEELSIREDNAELKEILGNSKEVTSVSDEPVRAERTDEIIKGGLWERPESSLLALRN